MRRCVCVLTALTLVAGCGGEKEPKPQPVSGQVFLGKQPAEGAFLIFHPIGAEEGAVRPRAWVAADGSFRATSFRAHDGALPGEYAVTVEWRQKDPGDDDREGPDLLAGKFRDPKTTPFRVRVVAGDNDIPLIQLDR